MCWDVIAALGVLAAFFFWGFNKLDSDIKLLSTNLRDEIKLISTKLDASIADQNVRIDQHNARTDQLNARTDQLIARMDQQNAQQSARADQLYQMFIDLLKAQK